MTLEDAYRIVRDEFNAEKKGGSHQVSPEYKRAATEFPVLVALAVVALWKREKIQVDSAVLAEDLPPAQIF